MHSVGKTAFHARGKNAARYACRRKNMLNDEENDLDS